MRMASDFFGIFKRAAIGATLFAGASVLQSAHANDECGFLDYTGVQGLPTSNVAEWRVKTHLVAQDKGDPCALEVLDENGIDTLYNIASLNKKMTAVIAWDEIRAGRLDLDEELVISDWAYAQSSKRSEKRTITVREALDGIMVGSLNDAATTLAVRIASGKNQAWSKSDVQKWEKVFAKDYMTAKAHELGMRYTHYYNATGLDEPLASDKIVDGVRHYQNPLSVSTPREQAFLSSYIRNYYPEILEDSAQSLIYMDDTRLGYRIRIKNTNRLLPDSVQKDAAPMDGVIGLKTGGLMASAANQSTVKEFNYNNVLYHLIAETSGDSRDQTFKTSTLARNDNVHRVIRKGEAVIEDRNSSPSPAVVLVDSLSVSQ